MGNGPAHARSERRGEAVSAVYSGEKGPAECGTDAAGVILQVPNVVRQIADVTPGFVRININVNISSAVPEASNIISQILQIRPGLLCININLYVGRVLAEVGNAVCQILNIGLRLLSVDINVDVCGAFSQTANVAGQVTDAFLGLAGICVYGDVSTVGVRLKASDIIRQIADILGRLFSISDDVNITRSLGPQSAQHPEKVMDTLFGLRGDGAYGYAIR